MLTALDANGVEQFVDQTDLNGAAPGGTSNPLPSGTTYTSMQAAMQAILDFANNDLAAIQTTMAGYAADFAAINTSWNDLLTVQWPNHQQVMDDEVDAWLARLSGSLSADGRVLIKKTPGNQLNWMYRFPKKTWQQVRPDLALGSGTMEAFVHGSGEYDWIAIDMFEPALVNGELVSQPGQVPYVNKNRDEFKALFAAQQFDTGNRHLWNVWERSVAIHEINQLGTDVLGNDAYGVSHEDGNAAGVCPIGTYILTGSMGPLSSHTGTAAGLYDLGGNVWEWVDQFESRSSVPWITPNNDIAAVMADSGLLMSDPAHLTSQSLQRAGIVSSGSAAEKGNFWINHGIDAGLLVGARWAYGAASGPFARSLSDAPSTRLAVISARGALVPSP